MVLPHSEELGTRVLGPPKFWAEFKCHESAEFFQ
jgi:hypothetical protein